LASGANLRVDGFEVLNESSSISIPKGEIVSNGKKEVVGTATTTAYNSGFDGSPTLNGRGGRVVKYIKDGRIGKVIQQANDSSFTFGSANHTNEEVIRRINFREFGANLSTDFSTVVSSSDRAFTLDDGTTTFGASLVAPGTNSGIEYIGNGTSASTTDMTITFVGTGLDLFIFEFGSATTKVTNVFVDGVSIGQITKALDGKFKISKIVSGLPYGTHTVRLNTPGAAGQTAPHFISDIIVYGPKKPSIPDGAVEIGEYYLMANFSANATAGGDTIAAGVLRKTSTREMAYIGTWSATLNINEVSGNNVSSTTNGSSFKYTFFGTGIDLRFGVTAGTASTWQVNIVGATNLTASNGSFWTGSLTTSNYGTGITSFIASTGTITLSGTASNGNGVSISGLNLGLHTITVTKTNANTAGFFLGAVDIVTPIHYPNTKRGSLALKPSASFPQQSDVGSVDLSKAKAWCVFDQPNGKILASYNISAVLTVSTGVSQFFFEKPFKTSNYSVVCSGDQFEHDLWANNPPRPHMVEISSRSSAGAVTNDSYMTMVVFGELADEGDE
jgi:hypothetical protein